MIVVEFIGGPLCGTVEHVTNIPPREVWRTNPQNREPISYYADHMQRGDGVLRYRPARRDRGLR